MNTRHSGLKLISRAIGGCLDLLEKMNIKNDWTDEDLKEVKRNFERAKLSTNNALDKHKNKGEHIK